MSKDFKLAKSLSRRTFLKGVGVAAGVAAVPGAYRAFSQGTFQIGTVVPLTGQLENFGPRFQIAANLAVSEINDGGGIPGVGNVELVERDSGTDADTGVAAATDLVTNVGVPAIFGAAASSVTIPITGVAIANGRLQISPSATSPAITNLDDNDLIFRTAPPDSLQGIVLADLAFNQQGYRSIAIIARNDAYGEGLALSLQANFEALGGTVTAVSLYDPNTTDFSAEIAEASADSPDAISLIGFTETEQLVIQMVQSDVTNFDLFVDGNRDQVLLDSLAEAVGADVLEGIVGTAPATADSPFGDAFTAAYRAETGEDPFVFTPNSFDALAVLCLAAARTAGAGQDLTGVNLAANIRSVSNAGGLEFGIGSLDLAIAEAAAGNDINYQGVSGPVEFDDAGDPFGPVGTFVLDANAQIVNTNQVDCGFNDDGSAFCDPLGG